MLLELTLTLCIVIMLLSGSLAVFTLCLNRRIADYRMYENAKKRLIQNNDSAEVTEGKRRLLLAK